MCMYIYIYTYLYKYLYNVYIHLGYDTRFRGTGRWLSNKLKFECIKIYRHYHFCITRFKKIVLYLLSEKIAVCTPNREVSPKHSLLMIRNGTSKTTSVISEEQHRCSFTT